VRIPNARVMPYVLLLYLYLFVVGVVVVVLSVWLSPYGLAVNIAFALIAAYLVIIIGRRVLRRKNL
jgi:membrane protein implicated in regulation of membrane protease activity